MSFRVETENINELMALLKPPCPECGAAMIAELLDEIGPVLEYLLECTHCDHYVLAEAEKIRIVEERA